MMSRAFSNPGSVSLLTRDLNGPSVLIIAHMQRRTTCSENIQNSSLFPWQRRTDQPGQQGSCNSRIPTCTSHRTDSNVSHATGPDQNATSLSHDLALGRFAVSGLGSFPSRLGAHTALGKKYYSHPACLFGDRRLSWICVLGDIASRSLIDPPPRGSVEHTHRRSLAEPGSEIPKGCELTYPSLSFSPRKGFVAECARVMDHPTIRRFRSADRWSHSSQQPALIYYTCEPTVNGTHGWSRWRRHRSSLTRPLDADSALDLVKGRSIDIRVHLEPQLGGTVFL